jgi:PHP family Zn ribbon phosphoesterase
VPAFNFACECGNRVTKLRSAPPAEVSCPECGRPMKRAAMGPTSRCTEVLDNGAMSRPLERLDNAEEIFRDRARTDPRDTET